MTVALDPGVGRVVVYPSRTKLLIVFAVGVGALVATGWGAVALSSALTSPLAVLGFVVLSVGFVILGVVLVPFCTAIVKAVLRHDPLLRIDEEGLECRAGRIRWSQVARVSVDRYVAGESHLDQVRLSLKDGVVPAPARMAYARDAIRVGPISVHLVGARPPRLVGTTLELPMWTRHRRVIEILTGFYDGPIDATPRSVGSYEGSLAEP